MKNQSEATCIRKRKAMVVNFYYHLLRIFPVKKNKVVFTAFEGDGGYCCNPRYPKMLLYHGEILNTKNRFTKMRCFYE